MGKLCAAKMIKKRKTRDGAKRMLRSCQGPIIDRHPIWGSGSPCEDQYAQKKYLQCDMGEQTITCDRSGKRPTVGRSDRPCVACDIRSSSLSHPCSCILSLCIIVGLILRVCVPFVGAKALLASGVANTVHIGINVRHAVTSPTLADYATR